MFSKNLRKFVVAVMVSTLPMNAFAVSFSDVDTNHPYYSAIVHLSDEGVINGYEDGSFQPEKEINRAELVKVLVEGLGFTPDPTVHKNCFPDVREEWFASYVCFAKENKWIEGYPDKFFHPGRSVNRAEALKIVLNAFSFVMTTPSEKPFEDVEIDDWFAPFVDLGKQKNILPEKDQLFDPSKPRTRGEVALIISRTMKIKQIDEDKFEEWNKEWEDAEAQTLILINEIRAENGKQPLKLNPFLNVIAREHSKDMAERGELTHEGSDGTEPFDRIKNSGATGFSAGAENVGAGTVPQGGSIYEVIEAIHRDIYMKEADGVHNHKSNLLSSLIPFNEVGIGIYVKDGKVYFTSDFVVR